MPARYPATLLAFLLLGSVLAGCAGEGEPAPAPQSPRASTPVEPTRLPEVPTPADPEPAQPTPAEDEPPARVAQVAKLDGPVEGSGASVALSGDVAIVGVAAADGRAGAANVYVREADKWKEHASLLPADENARAGFGWSVALDGDTAVVGTMGSSAAAYVFVRWDTMWVQEAKLTVEGVAPDARYGWSVAIDNETVVIGSPWSDENGDGSGSAYVFERSEGVWTQTAKLLASDGGRSGAGFGHSVAVSNSTIVVGSPYDGRGDFEIGSAHAFERVNGKWNASALLLPEPGLGGGPSRASAADVFGFAVDVDGDVIVVGDPRHDSGGSAYVYVREGLDWVRHQRLVGPTMAPANFFGGAVSVSGQTILVGHEWSYHKATRSGLVTVFHRAGHLWATHEVVGPADGAAGDGFGTSVALEGARALVGSSGNGQHGSVYIYEINTRA